MTDSAKELSQEYWRPVQPPHADYAPSRTAACPECGTEYATGARFCHVCGSDRDADLHLPNHLRWLDALDFQNIRRKLGLSVASLVFVIIAAGCVLATIMTGFIYNASTLNEWQAVQIWRTEWMLAAIVALIAGILFNRQEETKE